jgi:hypothetical protein
VSEYGTQDEQGRYQKIRSMLNSSAEQMYDCDNNTPNQAFKTMMNLKTKCPTKNQSNIIESIKYRGQIG